MDSADHMTRSIEIAVAAIRGADPARFSAPSPCSEYTVEQAVSHLAFGLLLAQRAGEREAWDPEWSGTDTAPYLVGEPAQRWGDLAARQAKATARAWADPRAWEGATTFGGGEMPAAAVGSMMTAEFAVHAWDVAVATGQPIEVPAPLGETVLEGVLAIAPMGRDGGWFAPEVQVPGDAPAFVRALAASGRDPQWTPGD
ncbi:TIGR03086 family metal-binding protein [Pseudonocardia aurantiaca]|uniref:TIGR03086 family metal-binding protein n=2 Tax=Pseudonocardia aurantiaca TaxID=75290 RepID=A0ABW4FNI1_9PSEU